MDESRQHVEDGQEELGVLGEVNDAPGDKLGEQGGPVRGGGDVFVDHVEHAADQAQS